MDAPSTGSPATHRRGGRVWLAMGLLWCAGATLGALLQPPGPVTSMVPASRAERGLWDWWRFPVERNAFLRLPAVSGCFNSMAVDGGGERLWLVGCGGAMVATANGGASWQPQATGTTQQLTAIYASTDGRHLWATGEAFTLIASSDGGSHWAKLPIDTDRFLTIIQLASDARRGWIAGREYVSSLTEDGGDTWEVMPGLPRGGVRDMHFDNAGRSGLAIGWGGGVFTSENGGYTWRVVDTPLDLPAGDTWTHVTITPDAKRAGLLSEQGRISWWEVERKTWTTPASGGPVLATDWAFSPDGRRGIAIGGFHWLANTTNGGLTWQTEPRAVYRRLMAVRFNADGQKAWVLGDDGYLVLSRNGGQSWSPATRRAVGSLKSIGFADDGHRGWTVGADGVVLRTEDGGATWRQQNSGTSSDLGLLQVSGDGIKAWATAQDSGRVFQTTDGGARWAPGELTPEASALMQRSRQPLAPPMPLPRDTLGGYVEPDSGRGWAVGEGGLLLATRDGGRTWADPRVYARYPAPWYWLALLLSVPMFLRAWRLFTQARLVVAGMADTPATDAALTDPRQDRLNFEPLAAGISRFLRNPATEPPLTLAITGDWGSGKSSLMGLVCADLRKHGSRPIWFNAWHHQKEDHLFAALLGALSQQALPPWLSLDGIGFRLRLLWMRSRKHWVFTVLLCAAVALLVTLHAGMNDPAAEAQMLQRVGQTLSSLAGQDPSKAAAAPAKATSKASAPDATASAASSAAQDAPPLPWAEWLALLAVAGTTLTALRKALTAFGADPAALLAGGIQGMKPKLAAEQNSFRTRFAEQFGEVSRALPERVVVVIDDLDRCGPEAVLEIMEAVNFLTSSGQCFVLFGMATDKVQAALAIAFERIAKELASASAPDANPEQAAREQRRAYAANYLQKLINLEIKVPTAQTYEAWRLLTDDPATTAPSSWRREAMQGLRRHAMWLALAGAIAGGVSLGVLLRPQGPLKAEAQDPARASVSTAASGPESAPLSGAGASSAASAPRWVPIPGLTASDPTRAWGRSPAQSETRVLVQAGADSHADEWIVAGVLIAGAAMAGLLLLRAASRRHREATDSKDFRDALKVWTELVRESAHTPRAVKRFGNKLRYFEMLQQGDARDRTLLEEVREYWRARLGKAGSAASGDDAPRTAVNRRIAAPQLVALGALHEAFGSAWLRAFHAGTADTYPTTQATSLVDDSRLVVAVGQLTREHQALFDTSWPPTQAEIDVFIRLLDGIRMPGESEELDMRRPDVA
ncbi:YCF48-related protein [Roseateles chitinivorans]|uniref:YCF48-related protein n=1 Tax=Roseateles chitinivorans TaxID=2917965 RepID=UPI003D66E507